MKIMKTKYIIFIKLVLLLLISSYIYPITFPLRNPELREFSSHYGPRF